MWSLQLQLQLQIRFSIKFCMGIRVETMCARSYVTLRSVHEVAIQAQREAGFSTPVGKARG